MAFYGCSTNSYDTALRNTEGFGTREADVLVTNRTTWMGAEVPAFLAFLDGIIGQTSAERMLGSMNQTMREGEARFSTNPWRVHGPGRQSAPLTDHTRGFARQGLRYYDPVEHQTRPTGRENTSKKTLSAS